MPMEHELALPVAMSSEDEDDFEALMTMVNNAPIIVKQETNGGLKKKETKKAKEPSDKARPNYVAQRLRGGGGYRGRGKSTFRGRGRRH